RREVAVLRQAFAQLAQDPAFLAEMERSGTEVSYRSGQDLERRHTKKEGSRQLVVALAEALQAHREANALFRGLETAQRRGLPGAQLLDQIFVHDDLGHAAIWQA